MTAPDPKPSELLPCPFCGFKPDPDYADCIYPVGKSELLQLVCYECAGGCGATVYGNTRAQCISTWNRRTPPPQPAQAMGASYWLIEYFPIKKEPSQTPKWWNGTHWNAHEDAGWTENASNAIRFVTQTEAAVVSMALLRYNIVKVKHVGYHEYHSLFGEFRPTEHEWVSK